MSGDPTTPGQWSRKGLVMGMFSPEKLKILSAC